MNGATISLSECGNPAHAQEDATNLWNFKLHNTNSICQRPKVIFFFVRKQKLFYKLHFSKKNRRYILFKQKIPSTTVHFGKIATIFIWKLQKSFRSKSHCEYFIKKKEQQIFFSVNGGEGLLHLGHFKLSIEQFLIRVQHWKSAGRYVFFHPAQIRIGSPAGACWGPLWLGDVCRTHLNSISVVYELFFFFIWKISIY